MKRFKTGPGGFTLVEIMIVVAIIALLATLAIPAFLRARTTTQQNLCIEHLWELESVKAQWAIENGIPSGQAIPDPTVLDPFIKSGTASIACPTDGDRSFATSYQLNAVGTDPVCLISPATHTL